MSYDEPSAPPVKPPYCPPGSDHSPQPALTTLAQFRASASKLAALAAECLRTDSRGHAYIESSLLEGKLMKALIDAHAAGMIEATELYVRDRVEKGEK